MGRFFHASPRRGQGFALGLAVSALVACVGPTLIVQQYDGPARPPESVATLRVNGGEPVSLVALDGADLAVPLAADSRLHIELEPGRHAVTTRHAGALDPRPVTRAFVAEAGRVYRVVYAPSAERPDRLDARIMEVDRGSDAPHADRTERLPPRRRPVPRPSALEGDGGSATDAAGEPVEAPGPAREP